jgi:DNA polymerase-3 subunit delta'
MELFGDVVGQSDAVNRLRALARHPVHAYLIVGPPGSGITPAARAFAGALVCPNGGCGQCDSCHKAMAGTHPDIVTVERTGAALGVDDARKLVALAQRRPFSAPRQVLVVPDAHLAARSVPALLKTVEEPPPTTVFLLLAHDIPPELATVASRCVKITFPPVPHSMILADLVRSGVDRAVAELAADEADGDVDRARLLATDPEFRNRLELWRTVPKRLDGLGSTAAALARSLLDSVETAVEPVRARHAHEIEVLKTDAQRSGERALPGRKDLMDAQHREERRWRTDMLRSGLGALARTYRDLMLDALTTPSDSSKAGVPGGPPGARQGGSAGGRQGGHPDQERVRRCQDAVQLVSDASRALRSNPNEMLLLEALMVRLGTLGL